MRIDKNRIKNFLHYNIWIVLLDIVAFSMSYLLTLYIRLYVNGVFRFGEYYLDYFWHFIPYYTIAALIVFFLFRLYGGMWQYAGLHDLNRLTIANFITAALHIGISILVISFIPDHEQNASRMPTSYYAIGAIIQFLLTTSIRFINRYIQEEKRRFNRKNAVNAMMVGTGETSRIVRRQLEEDSDSGLHISCIFTYKDTESGSLLDGIPVVARLDHFNDHLEKYKIKRVILADSLMPMSVREQIRSYCQAAEIDVQDFSGFLRYDNSGLPFQKLMECVNGKVTILEDGKTTQFDNGEQALMTIVGKHDVKSISIHDGAFFIELLSYKVKPLIVFFITNRPDVALVAEKYGVDRIWVDLEVRGKEQRQHNLNTMKSHHSISDIAAIKPLLTRAEMMVRINSWYEGSQKEIDDVIAAGADIIMLPYWKTVEEVRDFINAVHGSCRTSLLLETKEAVECIDEVLAMGGFDEIHIGLNDLHLSYGMSFMFEPLADGLVESLCDKFKKAGVPYGFGGIAKLGDGILPAERIIMEHYRLGSTRAILSRSFCDTSKIDRIEDIDHIFRENMEKLREYEVSMANTTQEQYVRNKVEIARKVEEIAERISYARSNGLYSPRKGIKQVYKKYIKRLLDIVISLLVVVLLSPVYLITAIAIKLDSKGPAILKQTRLGLHHKEFTLLKFRSMVVNAEHTGSGVYSDDHDSRLTKVGRIIRKTSIDELPQAINILKGDMSLIGPRPPLTYHPWPIEQYSQEQLHMFDVRPGITGWAQVNGRKTVEWNERIKLNNWYVDHCSFLLDVKIFFKTIAGVLTNADNESVGETVKKGDDGTKT